MRKQLFTLLLTALLLSSSVISAQAQAPQYAQDRGVIQIGAATNLTLAIQSISGSSTTSFTLAPTIGYFVIPNLAVGGTISLSVQSQSAGNQSRTATTFGIGPAGTYYFADKNTALAPLVGAGLFFTTSEGSNAFDFEFIGGVNYMVSKNVGLTGFAFLSVGPREGATALGFGLRGAISAFLW
jgi:outer membrane protein